MGLIRDIEFKGIIVNGTYARIHEIRGNKLEIGFTLSYYANQIAYLNGTEHIIQESYNYTPSIMDDAPNFISQAYLHLKALPEFSNAIDA